jgi:hypothetical protein
MHLHARDDLVNKAFISPWHVQNNHSWQRMTKHLLWINKALQEWSALLMTFTVDIRLELKVPKIGRSLAEKKLSYILTPWYLARILVIVVEGTNIPLLR